MYSNIKEKLEILNKDMYHYINSNDICTPMSCVEEMIDKIPNELWHRESISILDPCTGNGNFLAYILEKINNIKTEMIGNEINEKRLENLKELLGNKITITKKDFFKYDENKKYDLIIANPPYAKISNGKRAAKNHGLSKDFIRKSLKLLKQDGYLVYIVPDNWMSLSDRNDITEKLSQLQFIYLNIHGAKKYFPKIGSSFTWFIVKNTDNLNFFEIDNFYIKREKSQAFLLKGVRSIPLFYNNEVYNILKKTIYSNEKKFNIETTSNLHKHTKKLFLSEEKNDEFKYKIIHTQNKTIWSKIPHKYQYGYKVFISLTSYYSLFIDKDCGMTQSIAFIRCNNKKEAEEIKEILEHPLYKFLNNIHRYGNFNNIRILQNFPVPKSKENIWDYFNISENEKTLILSTT